MTLDIKNFYLNTPMKRKEYMRVKLDQFPHDIVEHYHLKELVAKDEYVYIKYPKECTALKMQES